MKKLVYLECPTGIAGDMCLGALVHAGVPLDYLKTQLARLGIADEYELTTTQVHRNGQVATKFQVRLTADRAQADETIALVAEQELEAPQPAYTHHTHSHSHSGSNSFQHQAAGSPHRYGHEHSHAHSHHSGSHPDAGIRVRHLPEIEQLIQAAGLPDRVADWSLAIFRQLAAAEAAVHGVPPEQVHFHEVGATDAIIDIVGTCLGLDWLGMDQLYCSPLPTGGGTVQTAHGLLPVPTPAVLKLWEMRQVPVYANGIQRELVTPTGAAIATTLATQFGPPPAMTLHQVGLGAGSRNLALPNILRLWIGEGEGSIDSRKARSQSQPTAHSHAGSQPVSQSHQAVAIAPSSSAPDPLETVMVLETQIDDLSPQGIGYVLEQLLAAGALDVFTQAVGMKKSRPGVLVTVICHPDQTETCEQILFAETTTLGIRRSQQQRRALHREFQSLQTAYGSVQVKIARLSPSGPIVNVQPEYEDCVVLARQHQVPWLDVHRAALQAWSE